jgi:hypothetical protein
MAEDERWRNMTLDDLIRRRANMHAAHIEAYLATVPLRTQMRHLPMQERLTATPTDSDFETIPGLREAYAHEQLMAERWHGLKAALTARFEDMSFTEQLNRFAATADAVYPNAFLKTFGEVVRAHMRFLFENRPFSRLVAEGNGQALSVTYDIESIRREIQEWLAWRAQNPLIFINTSPTPPALAGKEAELATAQQLIRDFREQRSVAVALGSHPRTGRGSLLRRLDPLMLQEIGTRSKPPLPAYRPWDLWTPTHNN